MFLLIATLSVALGCVSTKAELRFTIGNQQIVENYCATNTQRMRVNVYQRVPGGFVTIGAKIDNHMPTPTSFDHLQQIFQQQFREMAEKIFTTTNTINKDAPFGVYVTSWHIYRGSTTYLIYIDTPFSLIKSNGVYSLPDLSKIRLKPNGVVGYEVPGIKWARVEYYYPNAPLPFITHDPMEDPDPVSTGIYLYGDFPVITLDTEIITSCLGPNSLYRAKIMVVSGDNEEYTIFDSTGQQVAGTPISMAIIKSPSDPSNGSRYLIGAVTGGDPGRLFTVESAPAPNGPWSPEGGQHKILNYGIPLHVPLAWGTGEHKFYRIKTQNGSPMTW